MITPADAAKLCESYDTGNLTVGTLGGHSALDVCRGAKAEGLRTIVIAQKGRERTYTEHYKSRPGPGATSAAAKGIAGTSEIGCVDEVIVVDSFKDVALPAVQKRLRELNTIFIHSRYFWVYCDFNDIENNFNVPIFGNRVLVRKEERDEPKNQYFLLKQAGIPIPKQFSDPSTIDRLVLVKAAEAARGYERAFFLVSSHEEYKKESAKLVKQGTITPESLKAAVIEEFALGPQLNLNLFYSPLAGNVELLGTDTRRQTNLDGILRMTAPEQIEVLKHVRPQYIENGHQAVTIKESLVEKAYDAGERFVKAVAKTYPPGMIGPFALQGAVTAGPPKEEFVVFDVSMRIPGSPGAMFTPYSGYLYGENISVGRRIAREITWAAEQGRLSEIVS